MLLPFTFAFAPQSQWNSPDFTPLVSRHGSFLVAQIEKPVFKEFRSISLPSVGARVPKPRIRYARWGNCVYVVRSAGWAVPRSRDGFARTIPVTSGLPPEGQLVVVATYESKMGHVLVGYRSGDKIIAVVDSVGAGRSIPTHLVRGYIET